MLACTVPVVPVVLPVLWPVLWTLPPLPVVLPLLPALPDVLPVLWPELLVLAFTVPVVPVVLPVLWPVLWTFAVPLVPVVLPVLCPVLWSLPELPVVLPELLALPLVLPVLALVLLVEMASWFFDLSSPLPLLPPATSPLLSALFSPVSFELPLPAAVLAPPELPLPLSPLLSLFLAPLPSPLPSPPPPISVSVLAGGLSLRWTTAAFDLLSPLLVWWLSAASAGDVRASMRTTPATKTQDLTATRCPSGGLTVRKSPMLSMNTPALDFRRLPAAILDTGPGNLSGDMSQNAPLSVPYLGNPYK